MSLATYTTELIKISRFLKEARKLVADDVTVQKLDTLVQVMLQPDGIPQSEILDKADLSRAAGSKNVADLTSITSRKKPGPNLVESVIDPLNRTSRTIRMTASGERKAVEALKNSFGGKNKK